LEKATRDTVDIDGLMTKDLALAVHGDKYVSIQTHTLISLDLFGRGMNGLIFYFSFRIIGWKEWR
jgi:hypothetical protein